MLEISPNFQFLNLKDLAELATLAEKYYKTDPNTSLIKCRQFIEVCAKYVSAKVGIYEEVKRDKLIFILKKLRNKKAIRDRVYYLFNDVRNLANSEIHLEPQHSTSINFSNVNKINSKTALKCIKKIHQLAIWYHKVYCLEPKTPFKDPEYIIPSDNDDLIKQLQEQIEELKKENQQTEAQQLEEKIEQSKLEIERQQEIIANSERDINIYLESSNLDKELTRISQETILKPDDIQKHIDIGTEINLNTILGTRQEKELESHKLAEGEIIYNHYEIATELSSGNFGTTYIAYNLHQPSKPLCVVKQFTPKQLEQSALDKARKLFNQEAHILERLGTHPEIPELFDFFEDNNNLFLIQEYVEGNTLKEELDSSWEEKEVIQLLKDILIPLTFIHENEIIHRDIKPDNLIRRVTDDKIVIIDFGAVKQVLEDDMRNATIIGTKTYMSPEQSQGYITYSCDIYAVGIIAIEALTGKKMDGVLPKTRLEEITCISEELKQILKKMIAFNPEDRYCSAKEVLMSIKQWNDSLIDQNLEELITKIIDNKIKNLTSGR